MHILFSFRDVVAPIISETWCKVLILVVFVVYLVNFVDTIYLTIFSELSLFKKSGSGANKEGGT